MSDQLTHTALPGADAPRSRWAAPVLLVAGQAVAVVALFAVVGIGCGMLWEHLWNPAQGVVSKHVWYPVSWDRAQPADFSGTGWYVSISIVAGLVLGAVVSLWLARSELVTLGAVLVGGLLAGFLIRQLGLHLSPSDPAVLAKTAADGTRLPSRLVLAGRSLMLVFPGAALVSLASVFLLVGRPSGAGDLGRG